MLNSLLKVRIKALFSSMFTRASRGKQRSRLGKAGLTLLMVYAFGCLLFSVGMMCQGLMPLAKAGLGWFYFGIMGLSAFTFCIIGGSFAAKSQIFEAKDNELLLSMPIPISYILVCRLLPLFLLNMIYSAFFLLPAGVVYAMAQPVTVLGAVAFVIGSLLIVTLGTAVSALLGWLISAVTARSRHKSLFGTVISLAFLGGYFYFYSNVQRYIGLLLTQGEEIGTAIRRALPFIYYFGDACASGKAGSILMLFLWSAVPSVVAFVLLRVSFLNIMTTKRGAAHIRYRAGAMRTGSPFAALYRKECRRLFSSTAYLMNSGIGAAMMVILAVLMLVKGDTMFSQTGMPGDMLFLFAVAGFCFCAVMIMPTACSISLEGTYFPLLRAMPVSTRDFFGAKIAVALTLGLPACLISGAVFGVGANLGLENTLLLILLPTAMLIWMAVYGLIINLRFPKFDWISETVVIKQSASVMIAVFSGMAFIATPGLLYGFWLHNLIGLQLFLWIVTVIFALLAFWGWHRLVVKGERLLMKI